MTTETSLGSNGAVWAPEDLVLECAWLTVVINL